MATDQERTPRPRDEGHENQFWHNPLLHLGACLAILAVGALLILAIHGLT